MQEMSRTFATLDNSMIKRQTLTGSVFSYDEFRRLLMTKYKKAKIDLIEWIMLRFSAVTLLLGCLRSEQFNRFREGGLSAIAWLRANRDRQGRHRPVAANVFVPNCTFVDDSLFVYSRTLQPPEETLTATSIYNRAKNRNGPNPLNAEEDFHLTIVCLCPDGHEPIRREYDCCQASHRPGAQLGPLCVP